MSSLRNSIVLLLTACALSACAGAAARNAVPEPFLMAAEVPGNKDVRIWADPDEATLRRFISNNIAQARKAKPSEFRNGARPNISFLALSGGGADGAYGAGFLNGWSRTGTRPEFRIVTGVSAGALIAPFAFLGPKYDATLRQLFTTHSTEDFARPQVLAGLLGGISVADGNGLKNLIARYADMRMLREVAREHRKGRRLYIATTNIDAERGVIWDMGAIAVRNDRRALKLFRDVLLASASIPGVFGPVEIPVRANGKLRQEYHVDGGLFAQVFFMPIRLLISPIDRRFGVRPNRTIYVLRNGRVEPEYEVVQPKTVSISARSLSAIIKSQSRNDLLNIYFSAQRNKMKFRLSSIPEDFDVKSEEPFDTNYIKALFNRGLREGRSQNRWRNKPPQLDR